MGQSVPAAAGPLAAEALAILQVVAGVRILLALQPAPVVVVGGVHVGAAIEQRNDWREEGTIKWTCGGDNFKKEGD